MPERAIASDMAVAETWTPSRRLQAAAAAERTRLERDLERLGMRERELSTQLAGVRESKEELEQQLQVLNRLAHNAERAPDNARRRLRAVPAYGPDDTGEETVLRGAAIREAAVRALAGHAVPGAPVHYRDWFELLLAQGFVPAGKDPLATFLTQIGRSPLVKRSTASGIYSLDLEFPERARQQLAGLNAQLNEGRDEPSGKTVEEIAAARERRAKLTAEVHELERRLEEALRCLAEPTPALRADG